jgi:hypothetical protein
MECFCIVEVDGLGSVAPCLVVIHLDRGNASRGEKSRQGAPLYIWFQLQLQLQNAPCPALLYSIGATSRHHLLQHHHQSRKSLHSCPSATFKIRLLLPQTVRKYSSRRHTDSCPSAAVVMRPSSAYAWRHCVDNKDI